MPEVAVILLKQNFTVLENHQAIYVLMRSDFVDRLFAPLKGNREISNGVIACFERKESIRIARDVHRGDYFPHVAERPAIDGAELEGFECQVFRSVTFLCYRN